jgi:FixJ family two-component response regulator
MSENGAEIVFVIDDEASVRRALTRLLASVGFQTEAFASALEFLQRPRHDGTGCLVLDVQMPGMDGLQMQAEMHKADYALPAIFISAHQDALKRAAEANVAGRFLLKPFGDQQLLEAVRSALTESRSRRAGAANPDA